MNGTKGSVARTLGAALHDILAWPYTWVILVVLALGLLALSGKFSPRGNIVTGGLAVVGIALGGHALFGWNLPPAWASILFGSALLGAFVIYAQSNSNNHLPNNPPVKKDSYK